MACYTRIAFTAASWLCVADYPAYFLLLFYTADIIGMFDKILLKSEPRSEKQNTEL